MDKLVVGERLIEPGERVNIDLPVALLHTQTPLNMPVQIIRGLKDGPRLFVSAAIHGDELNGIEIIRRLHQNKVLKRLHGTLITIPIVNVFGVIHHSRYLPDRRDLNRSFPGSERGSLAGRLANLFMTEIVDNATHGIDLHTGALHRTNLPQVRANMDDPETKKLAKVFGAPVILNSDIRDGSLRECAAERGMPMLLYEAGEALRFDELSIRAGVKGIINVMRELGMVPKTRYTARHKIEPLVARSSSWVRATESGVFRAFTALGARVGKGSVMGAITSPYGDNEVEVVSPVSGIVIGKTSLPLINEGDALFHIARFQTSRGAAENVEIFTEHLSDIEIAEAVGQSPIQ
ncbi:MAG: succinylglutamate desuccinylase [Sedimenticola sp.]|nr:MAG: succinylglutamate desuccinylase [Sedimenticola sp.]